jgi:hypothetical protein
MIARSENVEFEAFLSDTRRDVGHLKEGDLVTTTLQLVAKSNKWIDVPWDRRGDYSQLRHQFR